MALEGSWVLISVFLSLLTKLLATATLLANPT